MAPRYGADAFGFLAWVRGRLDEAEDVKMDETHPRGWIAAFLQRFITMDLGAPISPRSPIGIYI